MPTRLYTPNGKPITLGKKLGTGGEGAVYAVNGHADKVAKIYHVSHLPDADKQAKLRFMAENAHSDLLGYIAWVEQTLHKRRGGRVIGFLMQRIEGCAPIHTLYNPSHRRQFYPNANWQFLLYTARNIAVAVATLHKHGHVIGDINQGNLLFGKDSKVTLIDADSFQIQTPDTTHLCHVGVAHFTPPELQGNSQFDRVARSPNHDCFGLALLIFHLLFGGRHPFSGVPLIDDAGNLLEHDIKHYRYAYAPDHNKRGIKPPPTAIPIGLVPKAIQQLFVRAFTEVGRSNRPTANEWLRALEALRKNLQVCRTQKLHVYPKHLSCCPWCALEKRGLLFFSPQLPTQNLPKWDVYQRVFAYKKQYDTLPDYRAPITTTQFELKHFYATPTPLPYKKTALETPIIREIIIAVIFFFSLWGIKMLFPDINPTGPAIAMVIFLLVILPLILLFSGVDTRFFYGQKIDDRDERRLRAHEVEEKYNQLYVDLMKYEQTQKNFSDNKAKIASLFDYHQKFQQQYQQGQMVKAELRRALADLADELEKMFAKNKQFERKLQRSRLKSREEYLQVAQEVTQARADLNL